MVHWFRIKDRPRLIETRIGGRLRVYSRDCRIEIRGRRGRISKLRRLRLRPRELSPKVVNDDEEVEVDDGHRDRDDHDPHCQADDRSDVGGADRNGRLTVSVAGTAVVFAGVGVSRTYRKQSQLGNQ